MTANLISLASLRQGHKRGDTDDRPIIKLHVGELNQAVNAVEHFLTKTPCGLYNYGGRLVSVGVQRSGSVVGDDRQLQFSEVTPTNLLDRFSAILRFERMDPKTSDYIATACPDQIAQAYIDRRGDWQIPQVVGLVTAPVLRTNGTILDTPGYDPDTRLIYDPLGTKFPKVPDRPTKEQAKRALLTFKRLLRGFPFNSPADLSVALSAILTTVIRRALPVAPMHAFSAPTAGSGKSKLVNICSIIATGAPAATSSTGKDKWGDQEFEKRLIASALQGDAVLNIDNLTIPLDGELLCQLLTEHTVKVRQLGKSVNVVVPNTIAYFATGNNITIQGDLTRRVLVGTLDAKVERPETREFLFEATSLARRARPLLVAKALTVLRAYIVSKEKVKEPPLGSYDHWSRLVRDPLIWLGEADPTDVIENVRRGDPRLAKLALALEVWTRHFGATPITVPDAVAVAMERWGNDEGWKNPELRDTLIAVTGGAENRPINKERLAWWLRRNTDRWVGTTCFTHTDELLPRWSVVGAPIKVEEDIPF